MYKKVNYPYIETIKIGIDQLFIYTFRSTNKCFFLKCLSCPIDEIGRWDNDYQECIHWVHPWLPVNPARLGTQCMRWSSFSACFRSEFDVFRRTSQRVRREYRHRLSPEGFEQTESGLRCAKAGLFDNSCVVYFSDCALQNGLFKPKNVVVPPTRCDSFLLKKENPLLKEIIISNIKSYWWW